jgi:hypothetical protein
MYLNPHRPRYLDEALARQFTTAVRVGKKSKEAGKSIKEVRQLFPCCALWGSSGGGRCGHVQAAGRVPLPRTA